MTAFVVFVEIMIITMYVLMPIGAIACFHMAWNAEGESPERALVKNLLLLPATVYPVVLLIVTASSQPVWKKYGEDVLRYMAKGSPSGVFFPLFVISNGIIALAVARKVFARPSVLTTLSLLTCLLTCLFFALGNTEEKRGSLLQFSVCCGYGYGLFLVLQSREVLHLLSRHYPLLTGWLASVILTLISSFARSKELIAELTDEMPPECFIVTAAARGHQTIVRSSVDCTTGRLTNSQLATFRRFEDWMVHHTPRIHRAARAVYNVIAPPIARSIIFRWQADFVYLLLKPLEWAIRSVC